ncbi:hypothetical protein [Halogeometricum luteum]|jgi:hypothetical protein|uniref:Uncharacterized protein n=1 Tax=Halogeometricum luteum TaxID=2950537 RepID=A0ABU2GA74_9EURY|nr:hypothetical protein [Halogeometricum sp. S3BR5-2]MDS0297038.1 hypothetical protein [Halogeometricum sp. S3BR5-2]
MTEEVTEWTELSPRRQELLEIIEEEYTLDDKFGRSDVDDLLEDDENTTTKTLNNLAHEEDYYLNRVSVGGGPFLVANKTHEEDETAASPSQQESLARKMVNEEGLELTPEDYQWAVDASRNAFASKFNARASRVNLNPTWTRNLYQITVEGQTRIRANGDI